MWLYVTVLETDDLMIIKEQFSAKNRSQIDRDIRRIAIYTEIHIHSEWPSLEIQFLLVSVRRLWVLCILSLTKEMSQKSHSFRSNWKSLFNHNRS